MNIRKISLYFLAALPLCVCARFFQITETLDYENGFFINGKETFGYFLLLVILVLCAMVAVVSFKVDDIPKQHPKRSWLLAISASFVSLRLFWELFGEVMSFAMPAWQVLVVKFVTVITAIYFLILLVQKLLGFRISPMFHIIPAVYAIIKTIFTFINISALSVISDNIFLMASYCLLMLFFINYARIYNGVERKVASKKVVAWGLVASVICITFSMPTMVMTSFSNAAYLHSNISVSNTLFTMGCFIAVFIFEYFYSTLEKETV